MRLILAPLLALQAARGTLFGWVPVLIACGIGLWFGLAHEPGLPVYAALAAGLAALSLVWLRGPELVQPVALGLACVLAGLLLSGLRAHLVEAPVLGFRYYGPVEGRVVWTDRSQSDHVRVTLDRVVLERTSAARTPETVRISIHGDDPLPAPGSTIILTAHLTAPPGPSEPGGFDFRRMAFFDRLGAVGYTRTPVLTLAPPQADERRIDRLRAQLSAAIMARVPGQAGAFASGAVTGDRSGITQATVEDLRDSNLSHLLAISGMNMAFLVGFVFGLVRYGLALVPPVVLRVNGKKIAALAGLGVAAFYLALSGANVATERAFVMISVMLIAVLADRRALSLRTVAIAATILLVLRPESLLAPGFQMSFAATVVLVVGFAALDRQILRERVPRWAMPLFTLVLSSVLAGLATAPLAAAHFNRFTDYGLLANLLTVPMMGLLIMPGSVISVLLWPVGLSGVGLWMMEMGSRWILFIAAWIAGWEGSVTGIAMPGQAVLPLMALGVLWAILWSGRARWVGVLPVIVALGLWGAGTRPAVLVSADGGLVGLLAEGGRVLSAPKGAGFAASSWLENDGDLVAQEDAAARPGFDGPATARSFRLGEWQVVQLKGKGAADRLGAACAAADLVIVAAEAETPPPGCSVIDRTLLGRTGTLILTPMADGRLRVDPTETASRLWTERGAEPVMPWLIEKPALALAGEPGAQTDP